MRSLVWIGHHQRSNQVTTVPKKKPPKDSKIEEVQLQTVETKAQDCMAELLQSAAKARTAAIKLKNVEYAAELSQQLLSHAAKLEDTYNDMRDAVTKKVGETSLQKFLRDAEALIAFVGEAQAGLVGDGGSASQLPESLTSYLT